MREIGTIAGNYLLFLFSAFCLGGLESTLWYQIFGYTPAPNLWISILVFWTLYRKPIESLIMVYLLSICVNGMSVVSGPLILITNATIFMLLYWTKKRIYTSGVSYFMLLCSGSSLAFLILSPFYSFLFDSEHLVTPDFWNWLMTPILTFGFSVFIFPFYLLLDKISKKQLPVEMEAAAYE